MKIDPFSVMLWAKILVAVPDSYLWLLDFIGTSTEHLVEYFARWGIPATRLIIVDPVGKEDQFILKG